MQLFLDHRHAQGPPFPQQPLQHLLDSAFRLPGRQLQDPQVLLHRSRRLLPDQRVVRPPKVARRKQVRLVAVVGKRSRLADQPVDHVPVFDPVLATAPQPGQPLDTLLRVPHLDLLHADPRLHPLPDQSRRHRVHVVLHMNRAAPVHPHRPPLA